MNLLYTKYSLWEKDLFQYEIFQGIIAPEHFIMYDERTDLSDFKDQTNILVLNQNRNFTFEVAENTINHTKPYAIFLLSDECGNMQKWVTLCKENTIHFFHQYHHKCYNYGKHSYQIPLGYVSGFKSTTQFIKRIMERSINASFVGEMKSDRHKMLTTFDENMTNTKLMVTRTKWGDSTQNTIKPNELFSLYNSSIFIPIGRGNIKLDCFRFYEAIVAGAIPVVVADLNEIKETFNFGGKTPDMIHSTTWDDACNQCNILLNDKNKLQQIQESNLLWWNNEIRLIQKMITDHKPI